MVYLVYSYSFYSLGKRPGVFNRKNIKYILYWNEMPEDVSYFGKSSKEGLEIFTGCEKYRDCFLTSNRNLMAVEEFSAILFYIPTLKYDPPDIRKDDQRYVFVSDEAPKRDGGEFSARYAEEGFFNWTMTYRSDSDIKYNLIHFKSRSKPYSALSSEDVLNKNGSFVAFLDENCNQTMSYREILMQQLSKHNKIDTFGSCFNDFCQHPKECPELVQTYWFYLSFEDQYCTDYNKHLIQPLQLNTLPIVYGAGPYDQSLVINVENFYDIEQLSGYLAHLQKNPDEYLKYFNWKENEEVDGSATEAACKLCEMLNEEGTKKAYEDIQYWWFSKEESNCKTAEELPHFIRQYLGKS